MTVTVAPSATASAALPRGATPLKRLISQDNLDFDVRANAQFSRCNFAAHQHALIHALPHALSLSLSLSLCEGEKSDARETCLVLIRLGTV